MEVGSEEQFFKVVRAAFSQRRKTLPNTLSAGLGIPKAQAIEMLEKAGIPTTCAPNSSPSTNSPFFLLKKRKKAKKNSHASRCLDEESLQISKKRK